MGQEKVHIVEAKVTLYQQSPVQTKVDTMGTAFTEAQAGPALRRDLCHHEDLGFKSKIQQRHQVKRLI